MPIPYTSLLTALLALATVVGLVVLFGRLGRSSLVARVRMGRRIAVVESVAIDRSRSIRIVSCDGRELLLLTGGSSDVLLGWLPGPELPR